MQSRNVKITWKETLYLIYVVVSLILCLHDFSCCYQKFSQGDRKCRLYVNQLQDANRFWSNYRWEPERPIINHLSIVGFCLFFLPISKTAHSHVTITAMYDNFKSIIYLEDKNVLVGSFKPTQLWNWRIPGDRSTFPGQIQFLQSSRRQLFLAIRVSIWIRRRQVRLAKILHGFIYRSNANKIVSFSEFHK